MHNSLAKKLAQGQFTLEQLGCTKADIRELRDCGHRIHQQRSANGETVYYIVQGNENCYLFRSKKSRTAKTYLWAELSDLHAGCLQFDEPGLRNILDRLWDHGVREIHLSGDLCDGYNVYRGQQNNLRYWLANDQASLVADILLEYDFIYIACHGNHDTSYVALGSPCPVQLISDKFAEAGYPDNFIYLPTYCADLIIGGVVKRMVHPGGGSAYAKSYPGQVYVRNLLDSHGEDVYVGGNKYRLRFIQIGHYHTDVTFEAAGIQVTHAGNFQFSNDFTTRRGLVGPQGCRVTECTIQDGRVIEFNSPFWKPVYK